jgi:preprotein translocase subunit SecE
MKFEPKQWWERTKEFWRETRSELRKVTWPGRPEVISTTGVVLGAVIIFGLYLWLCDQLFFRAVNFVLSRGTVS